MVSGDSADTCVMTKIEAILMKAIESGEVVRIRYHGGTQPGTIREIVPRNFKGKYLYATCVISDSFKSFLIEKIEIVPNEDSFAVNYEPDKKPHKTPRQRGTEVIIVNFDTDDGEPTFEEARVVRSSPKKRRKKAA